MTNPDKVRDKMTIKAWQGERKKGDRHRQGGGYNVADVVKEDGIR